MKTLIRWVVVPLGALLGIAVLSSLVLVLLGGRRLNRRYEIPPPTLVIPTDSGAVTRGGHLVEAVAFCQGCHGDDLGGGLLFEEPRVATVYAPNLTTGRGGIGSAYSDADLVRAIRHGVNQEGRGLLVMHSNAFHNLSARDLGAIVAYLRTLPPVDRVVPAIRISPLGRILMALHVFDTETMPAISAEVIDHEAPYAEAPPPGPTPEYGEYLMNVALCAMCHGKEMAGAPPIEEGGPPGPNILVYGSQGIWSEEQFIETIRSGVTPYGKALDADVMPWKYFGRMTDDELLAIRRYLTTLWPG